MKSKHIRLLYDIWTHLSFLFFLICYSLSCKTLSNISTIKKANKNKIYTLKDMSHLHFFIMDFYLSLVLHEKV